VKNAVGDLVNEYIFQRTRKVYENNTQRRDEKSRRPEGIFTPRKLLRPASEPRVTSFDSPYGECPSSRDLANGCTSGSTAGPIAQIDSVREVGRRIGLRPAR
jgi:hypothetical protein